MKLLSPDILEPKLLTIDFIQPDIVACGELSQSKIKPYISGHITDGSSTFTFKVNNQNVTVPVDSNGSWKWKIDREINVSADFSGSPTIIEMGIINLFKAVTANNVIIVFHQNVWNMIMREIDVQGSSIQVAYQNMIDNYDVTIANASFDAEIEYIEGTGTQWLDTNTKFNVGTSFYVKFEELAIPETPTNRTHIFGVHEGTNRYRLRRLEVDQLYFLYGNNGASWVAENYIGIKNKVCEFTYTKDLFTFVLNDTTKTQTPTSTIQVATNNNITAFYNQPSGDTNMFVGRFYAIKIWENDTLVRDMIPVRKGTTGYLYDKVSGNLFGNSGTGDFVLGNDK